MSFLSEKMIYRRTDNNVTFNNLYLFYQTKQIDSMLPSVCPPIDSSQKTSKYGGNNSDALICISGAPFFLFLLHRIFTRFKSFPRVFFTDDTQHYTLFFICMARLTSTQYFCLSHLTSIRMSSPLPCEHLTIIINSPRKQGNISILTAF